MSNMPEEKIVIAFDLAKEDGDESCLNLHVGGEIHVIPDPWAGVLGPYIHSLQAENAALKERVERYERALERIAYHQCYAIAVACNALNHKESQ